MKTILEYLNENWYKQSLITESFKSSIIRQIRDQINDITEENHKYNAENKWGSRSTNTTFKSLFGSREWIKWSEITDEDFTECTLGDKEATSLIKRATSNRSNSFTALIVLVNDDETGPKFTGIIITGYDNYYYSLLVSNYYFNSDSFRTSAASGYLTKKFYVLDLTKFSTRDIRGERGVKSSGAISNNTKTRDEQYKKIAEKNRDRYKQYVAKVKADKDAEDGMGEKIEEYTKKILEVTIKMSKDPAKYVKHEYDVAYLLDLLRDERRYVTGKTPKQSYYSGTDGLLTVYKSYISKKLSMSKGDSYDFERKEYEAAKKKLESIFKTIDERLEKFADVA
ncbi:MAG: hypothetical protein IJH39_11225 [Clostridia bacterium]|nr:hypothetical protein [Clostridia bacterium]